MKRTFYIFCFTLLGLLISFLLHAILEMTFLGWVGKIRSGIPPGGSWEIWEAIHNQGSIVLSLLGLALGCHQGFYWWRRIYGRHYRGVRPDY